MSEHASRLPGFARGREVRITFDGMELIAYEGELLSTALQAGGLRAFRRSVRIGAPRGLYCGMGVCHDCSVVLEGRTVRSCRVQVTEGMQLRSLDQEEAP